jgi:2-polyprenyl-3-methyl-5-hydroxy-6-metoxy-1,4-benzoquinol methylase
MQSRRITRIVSQAWNYFVCQADVRQLPFAWQSFDFVVCLGVIQHTPNPEETIAELAKYIKPGASLVIDHYSYNYPATAPRRVLRQLLLRLPPRMAKAVCSCNRTFAAAISQVKLERKAGALAATQIVAESLAASGLL